MDLRLEEVDRRAISHREVSASVKLSVTPGFVEKSLLLLSSSASLRSKSLSSSSAKPAPELSWKVSPPSVEMRKGALGPHPDHLTMMLLLPSPEASVPETDATPV